MTTETDLALTRDIKLQTEQAVLDTMLMMKIVDSFRSGAVAGQAGQNITNGTGAAGPGGLSPRESAFPIEQVSFFFLIVF